MTITVLESGTIVGTTHDVAKLCRIVKQHDIKNNYSALSESFMEGCLSELEGFVGKGKVGRFGMILDNKYFEGVKLNVKNADGVGNYLDVFLLESEGITSRLIGLDSNLNNYSFATKKSKKGKILESANSRYSIESLKTSEYNIALETALGEKFRTINTMLDANEPRFLETAVFKKHMEMRGQSSDNLVECAVTINPDFKTLMVNEDDVVAMESLNDLEAITNNNICMVYSDLTSVPTFIESQAVRMMASDFKRFAGKFGNKMGKLPKSLFGLYKSKAEKIRRSVSEYRAEKDIKIKERVLQDEVIPAIDSFWEWALSLAAGYGALCIPVLGPVAMVVAFVVTKVTLEDKSKANYKRALRIFDDEIEVTNKKIELAQMKNDDNAIIALTRAKQALVNEKEKHMTRTGHSFSK